MRTSQGPFSAKTCFIESVSRIKIQVTLGLRASLVIEACMKNVDTRSLNAATLKSLKACLVILLGGQYLIIDEAEDPWDGVHAARFYVVCASPPEGVAVREFNGKPYMDLGDYLNVVGLPVMFDPNEVKRDFLGRK